MTIDKQKKEIKISNWLNKEMAEEAFRKTGSILQKYRGNKPLTTLSINSGLGPKGWDAVLYSNGANYYYRSFLYTMYGLEVNMVRIGYDLNGMDLIKLLLEEKLVVKLEGKEVGWKLDPKLEGMLIAYSRELNKSK